MKMRSTNLQIVALLVPLAMPLSTEIATAQSVDTTAKCKLTKQKIAKIHSKMRQGYSASQGVRMDDELRRLRKLRSKYCR